MIWMLLGDPALACSMACRATFAGGLLQPRDLADDVPVDVQIVVAGDATPRLLDADEVEVAVEVHPVPGSAGRGFRLVPTADLAPRASWSVVEYEVGRDAPTLLGSFTTGDGRVADTVAVPHDLVAIGSVHSILVRGGDSCSGVDHVLLDTTWSPTTGMYEVEVVREGGAELVVAASGEQLDLGWGWCLNTVPDLEPREQLEIRVRSLDLLGRPGDWSDPLVTSARQADTGCSTTGLGGSVLAGVVVVAVLIRRRRASGGDEAAYGTASASRDGGPAVGIPEASSAGPRSLPQPPPFEWRLTSLGRWSAGRTPAKRRALHRPRRAARSRSASLAATATTSGQTFNVGCSRRCPQPLVPRGSGPRS